MIKYYHLEDGFTPTDNYTEGDWIHLEGHEKKELEQITDRFDIPANLLADIYDIDERPRVDSGQGWTLVIIRIPRKRDGQKLHFATVPLLAFPASNGLSVFPLLALWVSIHGAYLCLSGQTVSRSVWFLFMLTVNIAAWLIL